MSRFATCLRCGMRGWADDIVEGSCVDCWNRALGARHLLTLRWHVNRCERCEVQFWSGEDRPLCGPCHQVPAGWASAPMHVCAICRGKYRPRSHRQARCMACISLRSSHLAEARDRGKHSKGEWLDLLSGHAFTCAYCGVARATTKDHIVPISRGGSDRIDNIAPACLSCNSSKNDRLLEEWAAVLDSRAS